MCVVYEICRRKCPDFVGKDQEFSLWRCAMTDLQREENARILLSHSQIKRDFFPHEGTLISDLYETVVRIAPEPLTIVTNEPERLRLRAELRAALQELTIAPETEYRPGFCERCGNFREIPKPIGYETGDYEMVPCPECAL